MRLIALFGAGCLLCGTQAAAQAPRSILAASALAPVPGDTMASIRFNIPAQPLSDALRAFSRQAAVRVQLDVGAAAGVRSQAVSGALTAPEALRLLLAGTGLTAQFADGETALVARGDNRVGGAYALTPLTVVGSRSVGYAARHTTTATRTDTPLRDAPQSVSVVTGELIADQSMQSMADVVRYVPGVTMGQGEGHRDAPTIRGNSSTADFFVDGVRDDAQYLRDLYNAERVEALKGSNAMIFGRGGGGGVINRVTREAQWAPTRSFTLETGSYEHRRGTIDVGQGLGGSVAARFNGVFEDSRGFRDEFVAPAFAPPVDARVEVDPGIGELPGAPPQLDRVIRTALEKDPDQRWQTAHDLARQRLERPAPEKGLDPPREHVLRAAAAQHLAIEARNAAFARRPLKARVDAFDRYRCTRSERLGG